MTLRDHLARRPEPRCTSQIPVLALGQRASSRLATWGEAARLQFESPDVQGAAAAAGAALAGGTDGALSGGAGVAGVDVGVTAGGHPSDGGRKRGCGRASRTCSGSGSARARPNQRARRRARRCHLRRQRPAWTSQGKRSLGDRYRGGVRTGRSCAHNCEEATTGAGFSEHGGMDARNLSVAFSPTVDFSKDIVCDTASLHRITFTSCGLGDESSRPRGESRRQAKRPPSFEPHAVLASLPEQDSGRVGPKIHSAIPLPPTPALERDEADLKTDRLKRSINPGTPGNSVPCLCEARPTQA